MNEWMYRPSFMLCASLNSMKSRIVWVKLVAIAWADLFIPCSDQLIDLVHLISKSIHSLFTNRSRARAISRSQNLFIAASRRLPTLLCFATTIILNKYFFDEIVMFLSLTQNVYGYDFIYYMWTLNVCGRFQTNKWIGVNKLFRVHRKQNNIKTSKNAFL